jgi:phage tail-like protein
VADNVTPSQVSTYLQYLPAILQEHADAQGVTFLGRFLLAFEQILSGLGNPEQPGLEEIIGGIVRPDGQTQLASLARYFDPGVRLNAAGGETLLREPHRTPKDFLPWLASWVALSLRADWSEEERRRFISRAVPVYQQRGTTTGLTEVLLAYSGITERDSIEIREFNQPFQLNVTATVGVDTMVGSGPPHFFWVKIILPWVGDQNSDRREQIVRAIIDQEKPAHTYYKLDIAPDRTMQVGVLENCRVGISTLLGEPPPTG